MDCLFEKHVKTHIYLRFYNFKNVEEKPKYHRYSR